MILGILLWSGVFGDVLGCFYNAESQCVITWLNWVSKFTTEYSVGWCLPGCYSILHNRFTFFTSPVQITTGARIAKACVFAPSSGFWGLFGTELTTKFFKLQFLLVPSPIIVFPHSLLLLTLADVSWWSYLSDIGKLQWRLKCGRDFESGVCSRFWGWSLVLFSFEAEVWSRFWSWISICLWYYINVVTLVRAFNPNKTKT